MVLKKEYIEIYDQSGNSICKKEDVFVGALGAE